ncbi:DUF2321 domain-containing protein [Faecalibaculum rodentium]|uniref:DUF2321 domain-containing protein n=1 Tax=Faecalibaculum rodentium TaxID=1702221 RepID=UPI0034E39149
MISSPFPDFNYGVVFHVIPFCYALKYARPYFCPYCGKPYPWTQKAIESAVELLALSEESLDAETRELLKNCLPDLMTDTPVSKVAAARWGQFLAKSGSLVKNAAHEIFNGIVTEAVLKILFN